MQQILDATCGGRMMWFDKQDSRVLALDCRSGNFPFSGGRVLKVEPDVVADYRDMPFPDASFSFVAFDPPHLVQAGANSWLATKYGKLDADTWGNDLRKAMNECFRVLKSGGVLWFKWSTVQISKAMVESIFPAKPVFVTGFQKTYSYIFIKP